MKNFLTYDKIRDACEKVKTSRGQLMNEKLSVLLEDKDFSYNSNKKAASLFFHIKDELNSGFATLEENVTDRFGKIKIKNVLEKLITESGILKARNVIEEYTVDYENLTDRQAYIQLRSFLSDLYDDNPANEEIKKRVDEFLAQKINPAKITNFLNNDDQSDKHLKDIFLNMFAFENNIGLFDSLVVQYLGYENIKSFLINEINQFTKAPYFNSVSAFKLCQAFPFLKEIPIIIDGVKSNYYQNIFELYFSEISKLNIQEKEEMLRMTDVFFKNHIESRNDSDVMLRTYHIPVLLCNKDWYKATCKNKKSDVISLMLKNDSSDSTFLLAIAKNKGNNDELKEYVHSREENLLIEYLNETGLHSRMILYKKLLARFPLLQERKNKRGLLDSIMQRENFMVLEKKHAKWYKEMPVNLLLGEDSEHIFNLSVSMPSLKNDYRQMHSGYREIYVELLELMINCLQDISVFQDENIEKAIQRFSLQKAMVEFIKTNEPSNHDEDIIEVKKIIEDDKYGLESYNDFEEFVLIKNLSELGYLPDYYLKEKKSEYEKSYIESAVGFSHYSLVTNRKRI